MVIRESSIHNLFSEYESILVIINKQNKPSSVLIVFSTELRTNENDS